MVRSFSGIEACRDLRDQINAINQRSARPSPFATYEFLESAVQGDEFSPDECGAELVLLTAMDGDRLVGYLPLKRREDRPFGRRRSRLEWLVIHDAGIPDLVTAPEDEARCAAAFVEYLDSCPRRYWTTLELAGQDDSSIVRAVAQKFPSHRYYTRLFPGNPTCAIPIRWNSVESYLHELPERRSVTQYAQKLLKGRTAEWIRSTDAASGRALLEVYLAVEQHSWKHGTSAAIARSPKRIAYYRSLFADDAPMLTRVSLLVLDGTPVAAEIIGAFNCVAYGFEIVFDEQFAAGSPGRTQKLLALHDCIRDGMTVYDLRWLFASYKERWLARTTTTENVQVFRRGSIHHLKASLGDLKRRIRPVHTEELDHNPSKRAAAARSLQEQQENRTPAHIPPDSRDVLARALASGIVVDRLSDEEVRAILPLRK